MSELGQLIKALATLSWHYNTFRGHWRDMPSSTPLCAILGILSFAVCTLVTYVEYGFLGAVAIPLVWLFAIWLFASEDAAMKLNKRLASAIFLLTIPAMSILILFGSGHLFIEILVGVYLSTTILSLKLRE